MLFANTLYKLFKIDYSDFLSVGVDGYLVIKHYHCLYEVVA